MEGDIQAEKPWHLPAGSACATLAMWLWAAVGVCPLPPHGAQQATCFSLANGTMSSLWGGCAFLSYLLESWVDSGGDLQAGLGMRFAGPRTGLRPRGAEPSEASGSHGPCWSPGAALQRHEEKRNK